MEGTVAGVRILPAVVEFFDADADIVHQMSLTVQNLSRTSKTMKFHGPSSKCFRLKVKNPDVAVAPGLEVTALVEYYTTKPADNKDRIILLVDEDIVEIPLIAYNPSAHLVVSGPLDFGTTVADGRVLSKHFTITNQGARPGDFRISYTGKLPLTLSQTSGIVHPGTQHTIRVEFISKLAGNFSEQLQVKLDSHGTATVNINAVVVEHCLKLLDNNTHQQVDVVNFGAAYYGTDKTQAFLLHNDGPEEVNFVVVLEEGADGEESGVDLTKTTTAVLAAQTTEGYIGTSNDLTSLVTSLPSHGILKPNQKKMLYFRFSPRFNESSQGWDSFDRTPLRRDYALFMHIETVGCVFSSTTNGQKSGSRVEVAVTGSALPVNVSISPSLTFKFGECPVGEYVEALCTISNQSSFLPVTFSMHKVSHFHTKPPRGQIKPGRSVDVILSFQPNQMGSFKPQLAVDILGHLAESMGLDANPLSTKLTPIHSLPIQLSGVSSSIVSKNERRQGTKTVTIPSLPHGQFINMSNSGEFISERDKPDQERIQRPKSDTVLVAHPNDLSTSIRPADRKEKIRTQFTKIERHTYVDPDYAYTDEEEAAHAQHKQQYIDMIQGRRKIRAEEEKARNFQTYNTEVDMGIKPGQGLKPTKLRSKDIVEKEMAHLSLSEDVKLLSTKTIEAQKTLASTKKISEGLNAVPITAEEKRDCAKKLTPQQLHHIQIGPAVIDFGQVCYRSVTCKDLTIFNNMDTHIHILAQIDCSELRQSSPLSQVVPPHSVAKLNLIFESSKRGNFERCVPYSINGHHRQHVVVTAEVVPVSLDLSETSVILRSSPGSTAEAGMRGKVSLDNKRNYTADFTWSLASALPGTDISIRPARGSVEAFTSLDCEVVYHPSYSSPDIATFFLKVDGGNPLKLYCRPEFGSVQCSFVERRLLFGSVALHLTTSRTAFVKNTGQNHAYFELIDPNPIPGMTVSPRQGVVPVGGCAEIKVEYNPDSIHKFDTTIDVNIKNGKPLSLRMGGTVEPPCVDVDMDSFHFGGVYCGAFARMKFKLCNMTCTTARLVFDLSRQTDFSIKFFGTGENDEKAEERDKLYFVSLAGKQVMDCALEFNPTEVASYDFDIPVTINHTLAPQPPPSAYPCTPAPSRSNWTLFDNDSNSRRKVVEVASPSRRILATALRSPLQLSHTVLEFILPSGYFELGIESGAGRAQGCLFVNNSDQTLSWCLHTEAAGPLLDDGTFKFLHRTGTPFNSSGRKKSTIPDITLQSGETFQLGVLFTPAHPGVFVADVPVILNGNKDYPYRILKLKGEFLAPELKFQPGRIEFAPVPLSTSVSVELDIIASGYRRACSIDYELPEIELEDGSTSAVLEVTFPDGSEIKPQLIDKPEEPCVIPCKISFESPRPVAFTADVIFTDGNSRYKLSVTATADNSMLTCYPFLAAHRSDFHIVCDKKQQATISQTGQIVKQGYGEAVIVPCVSPNRPPTFASTSATSTAFGMTSSSYESSEVSSEYQSTPQPADGAQGVPEVDGADEEGSVDERGTYSVASEEKFDTEEAQFCQQITLAVQRWFSLQGWAGGPYPIHIPHSLRSAVEASNDQTMSRAGSWQGSVKKESRSLFDLLIHICGRQIPGIPSNPALPPEPTERMHKIYWLYATLITFLRGQGAMLATVKAEHLLDYRSYCSYLTIKERIKLKGDSTQMDSEPIVIREKKSKFEVLSRTAWTNVLLQMLKVLVLSRITPHQFKKLASPWSVPMPAVNPDPQCSNVYSVPERIILAWVNLHFEQQRQKAWPKSMEGRPPASRWIVNFDFDFMDGIVLTSILAAHAPFLLLSHLTHMYTHPTTGEQCLHNAIKVVDAMRYLGLDYDVLPTDITEPNPVFILLLCVHLYRRLPQYLPRASIEFQGSLHQSVLKHIRLQNPSSKPLVYEIIVAGKDAADFRVPVGDTVQVPHKGQLQLPVEFRSRFLHPCSATLVLVGHRAGSACGTTLAFNLQTTIDNITPMATINCESPCYELEKVKFDVTNPFQEEGDFRIVLVESKGAFPTSTSSSVASSPIRAKQSKSKKDIGSRTDHGQSRKKSPRKDQLAASQAEVESKKAEQNKLNASGPQISAFWSPNQSVHLGPTMTEAVEIHFLPFSLGQRQCSILFINESIGEFLYSIEAVSKPPLPSPLPFACSQHSVRVSSAAAAARGQGVFGGDDRVVYWKCESKENFTEELVLPLVNVAKEKALVIAAQQRMSEVEIARRKKTGTLHSSSATASIAALSLGGEKFIHASESNTKSSMTSLSTTFQIETSSKFFSIPKTICIPITMSTSQAGVQKSKSGRTRNSDDIRLPVFFQSHGPGHYPCQIILASPYDFRVYQIECTVSPEGTTAELEFKSPTHQSITQDIPVSNHTRQDWHLTAEVEGDGFYGPPTLLAKALVTSYYPLMFRPSFEGLVQGKLSLTNYADGTEHLFKLKGHAEKPLALDHIVHECEAKTMTTLSVQVPNVTKRKLTFQASSDLDIVTGSGTITVLPGHIGEYTVNVTPWRRGFFRGVLAFNMMDVTEQAALDRHAESSDDEEGVHDTTEVQSSSQTRPYRLWYSIEVQATPPSPLKTLQLKCAVHSVVAMEITVTNPTSASVEMEVLIEGQGLYGEPKITLGAGQLCIYQVKFMPITIGESRGSVVFQHPSVGEFWYDVQLIAEPPAPTHLPTIQCEIGSSTHQMIRLNNPTNEAVLLIPSCSNMSNFSLELDSSRQLLLADRSTVEIPLKFTPSAIGRGNHIAEIIFKSEKLGDWIFLASGTGTMPSPRPAVEIYSSLGGNSSLIIPFRNPTEDTVTVDVLLKERTLSRAASLFGNIPEESKKQESAFCLLLKSNEGISVAPNAVLDIPFSFAPDKMYLHEAVLTISIHRQDGDRWSTFPGVLSSPYITDLSWTYPIKGIPESCPIKESHAPIVECQARSRVEECIEVTLTGVTPGIVGSSYAAYLRALTPIHLLGQYVPADPQLSLDYVTVLEEFNYELIYGDTECQVSLERSLGINLIRKMRNKVSGVVVLVFNVVFAPFKPFDHKVTLFITAASGGVWKYPLRFMANEPEVDDTINIEAIGLNKESVVGFRITSQSRAVVPFEAHFSAGSDTEFSVSPPSGELLPIGTDGTLIKVSYKPTLYGKTHQAKLVIQTNDMQWLYDIRGITPEYTPPTGESIVASSSRRTTAVKQRTTNYVRENLKLQSTGVSSPLKGTPLVSRLRKSEEFR